jgi:hypothetical protein
MMFVNMKFPKYFALTIFIILLLWGPMDDSWPYPIYIRIGYLYLIPVFFLFVSNQILKRLEPSITLLDKLERFLWAINGIVLLILAYSGATSDWHLGNTHYIQTRDGYEAVGEDVILEGADWFGVIVLLILACLFFWYGVIRPKKVRTIIVE